MIHVRIVGPSLPSKRCGASCNGMTFGSNSQKSQANDALEHGAASVNLNYVVWGSDPVIAKTTRRSNLIDLSNLFGSLN